MLKKVKTFVASIIAFYMTCAAIYYVGKHVCEAYAYVMKKFINKITRRKETDEKVEKIMSA